MRISSAFAATALAGVALAKDVPVSVSNRAGQLIFDPASIQAAQGDTVTFSFWPKNHSIAQSTFATPCQPLDGGFWSGFIPDASNLSAASTTWTYTVKNVSTPVWFYCSQGSHCQAGMVGVINAPQSGNKTLMAYKDLAKNTTGNVSPKSVAGTGGAFNRSSSGSSSSSSSSARMTPTTTASSGSSATSSASSGAIPTSSNAASHLSGSVAFAGLTGLLSYILL